MKSLNELDKLILKIEELRENLTQLIMEIGDLKHPDVIDASKSLDHTLNEYQKLLKEIIKSDDSKS